MVERVGDELAELVLHVPVVATAPATTTGGFSMLLRKSLNRKK